LEEDHIYTFCLVDMGKSKQAGDDPTESLICALWLGNGVARERVDEIKYKNGGRDDVTACLFLHAF